MTPNEVPEGWAELLVAARFVDRRNGRPSMRQLAAAARTHASTISGLMYGRRDTQTPVVERVIEAIAREARMNEREVREKVFELMHRALSDGGRFEPHEDANLLSREEQAAVNELIRLLALPKKQGGGGRDRSAANQTPAPSPADQLGTQDDYELIANDPAGDPLQRGPGEPDEEHTT